MKKTGVIRPPHAGESPANAPPPASLDHHPWLSIAWVHPPLPLLLSLPDKGHSPEEILLDRLGREAEPLPDFLVRQAFRDPHQQNIPVGLGYARKNAL